MLTFFGVLLLVMLGHAQQQGQLPNSPPYGTPPSFPGSSKWSPQEMPPDQNAPPMSMTEVKEQIQARLTTEPSLSNTTVDVMADERSLVLIGTVDTEKHHPWLFALRGPMRVIGRSLTGSAFGGRAN